MERACVRADRRHGGDAERNGIGLRGSHVDRVPQPLTASRPANVVSAARVSAVLDIDAVGSILTARVHAVVVVVRNALTAQVVVLALHRSGNRCGATAERSLRGCSKEAQIYRIRDRLVAGVIGISAVPWTSRFVR